MALYSRLRTEVNGNILDASNYNAEHQNHIDNQTAQATEDYSNDVAQMRSVSDPGESGTESLATSLAGELERLRFAIKDVTGKTYWYESPTTSIANLSASCGTIVGATRNIKLSLSSGVLKLVGDNGSDLSSTNPGFVCVPNVAGTGVKVLMVTTSPSINDVASGSSDLTNYEFGITSTADWGSDATNSVPFFIYAVNRGDTDITAADGTSKIMIARSPWLATTTSTSSYIGDTAAVPATDIYSGEVFFGTITEANYVSLPVAPIAWISMKYAASTHDWTIITPSAENAVGNFGSIWNRTFLMVKGQMGANSGTFLGASGGTLPVFNSEDYQYAFDRGRRVWIDYISDGDGGTDGSGANDMYLSVPTDVETGAFYITSGLLQIGTTEYMLQSKVSSTSDMAQLFYFTSATSWTGLQNAAFTNGDRNIILTGFYMALS